MRLPACMRSLIVFEKSFEISLELILHTKHEKKYEGRENYDVKEVTDDVNYDIQQTREKVRKQR